MKVLVLSTTYPSKHDLYAMCFVHTRVRAYVERGLEVTVLSFNSKSDYVYEGIRVVTKLPFDISEFDVVVSHAPNLRQHIAFLLPKMNMIKNLVFVFHGHEVVKTYRYRDVAYEKMRPAFYFLHKLVRILYEDIKVVLMKRFIKSYINKNLRLIFVSKWLYRHTLANLKMRFTDIEGRYAIINNGIGQKFIPNKYDNIDAKYDFICIRPIDQPYRCVDQVVKLAELYPHFSFHIYGKGKYFEYYSKPANIAHFNHFIPNDEIPSILKQYRAAIMLTSCDTQGVMACEMATYGIPLVTSKISVAVQMLKEFKNVFFYDGANPNILEEALHYIGSNEEDIVNKFSEENTTLREIAYISKKH